MNSSKQNIMHYFPNISSEVGAGPANLSCTEMLRQKLISSHNDMSDSDESVLHHMNCTIILTDGCNISFFLLENIEARKVLSVKTIQMPPECGRYNISCCNVSHCTDSPTSKGHHNNNYYHYVDTFLL